MDQPRDKRGRFKRLPKRSRELQIVGAPEGWFPRLFPEGGMTRSMCPARSPEWSCQFVLCRSNTQLVAGGVNGDRPGRYQSKNDDVIKYRTPSCVLDIVEAHGPLPARRIGPLLGISPGEKGRNRGRRVEQIIKHALETKLSKLSPDDLEDSREQRGDWRITT